MRADERLGVQVSYTLAPYLPEDRELPKLDYPYFEKTQPLTAEDVAAVEQQIREHQARWAEWEQSRRRK